MDNTNLYSFIKSLSAGVPLIIALVRIKKIDRQFTPFIVYLFLAVVTEICSFILIDVLKMRSNAVAVNVWLLAEWCLVMWQFYCWKVFASRRNFLIVALLGLAAWLAENIVAGNLFVFGPYCRLVYSFVIVILSINAINYSITHDFRNLFRNSRFIICLCFIIFFSYKIIYEWAYQVSAIKDNLIFSSMIISFFGYLNAAINLTYVLAVLFMPPAQRVQLVGTVQQHRERLL